MSQLKTNNITNVSNTGDPNIVLGDSGDTQVQSLNSGPLSGFRNQIINGDFRVWQRGSGPFSTTTPSSSEYSADRWYVNTNNVAVSRNAVNTPFVESFDRAVQSTASGNFSIAQMVELKSQGSNSQFYVGSTWTLSFWAKHDPGDVDIRVLGQFADDSPGANGVSVFDQTGGEGLVAGDTWQRLSFTFTVGATAALTNKGLGVYIRAATTGTFTLTGVQLESGPVATPFEHRPIGTELALCQRYYYKLATSGSTGFASGMARGAAEARFIIELPQEMRASPTFTYDGGVGNYAIAYTNTSQTCTLLSASSSASKRSLSINADASGMTAGFGVILVANGAGGFNFDAEL